MAGKVLSWDNFAVQAALISAPLVLSEIYSSSREAVYYVTAGVCFLGMLDIGYVATWKGSRDFGKKASYEEKKDIEMNEMGKEGAAEPRENNGVMVDITNADSPLKNSVQSPDELSTTTPTIAESNKADEAAKPVESVESSIPSNPSVVSNTNEAVKLTL